MVKQALGRGFDSLIPKDFDRQLLGNNQHRVQNVLISDILPNSEQPRNTFRDQELHELTQSVQTHGVLQPIIVVRQKNNKYKIVAGERRWRAASAAGLTHIPTIVRSLQDLEQAEIALIENIQRVDLSPLEQALAIERLQQHFNLTLEQIAQKLGRAISTVSNTTRLLKLPQDAARALAEGRISEAHARAILSLTNHPNLQQQLLDNILTNNWTVRQAEQFAVAAKQGEASQRAKARTESETPYTKAVSKKLAAPVSVRHTAKGGQLIIKFTSEKDLKRIIKQIG